MKQGVHLPQFPPGLTFPAELQNRAAYDSQKQELSFEGFMSKVDFDRLLRLSNDLYYQRALETLFQKCAFASAGAGTGERAAWTGRGLISTGWWIAGVAGAAALAAALVVFR